MKTTYFTVGPSELYPTVPSHLKTFVAQNLGSISHRGRAFEEIFLSATDGIRKLLAVPKTHHIFFLSSALEGMERSIQNTVQTHSAHIVTGDFGKKFAQTAAELGKKPQIFTLTRDELSNTKHLDIPKQTEVLCVTQNETSTGIAIPPELMYAYKKQRPNLLLAFDVVSSVPYQRLDFRFLDLVFFSVQKGFGLPAGLGVLIVSPQALEKAAFLQKKGTITGSYHSFAALAEKEKTNQTPETPNVLAIYLLGQVARDLEKRGMRAIREEIHLRAETLYRLFDKSQQFLPFVTNPDFRSETTLAVETQGKTPEILTALKQNQLIVSSGYGKNKTSHMRLANFPSHRNAAFTRLLTALRQYR